MNTMSGLSAQDAAERLVKEGYNELPSTRQHAWLDIVREALILLGSIFLIMGIIFYQEQKTERALEALRDLSSPRALVIREGEQRRIAGREVVRGDLLMKPCHGSGLDGS